MRFFSTASDSLLASPIEAEHLQNNAMLGAEYLGNKSAKVTYVGTGFMSLGIG